MDAPRYLPAATYKPPIIVERKLGLDTVSLRELLAVPATRNIILGVAPRLEKTFDGPFSVHLGNFTLLGISRDGMITRQELEEFGKQFGALPQGSWPL